MESFETFNNPNSLIKKYEETKSIGKNKYFDVDEFVEIIDFYYFEQKFKKAYTAVEDGLKIHPGAYDLLLRKSRVLIEFKQYDQAIKILKYLLSQDSSETEIYLLLGFAYTEKNKFSKAEQYFLQLLKLTDDLDDKLIFLRNIAQIYFNKKNYSIAYKYYQIIHRLNPKDSNVLYDMAFCLERQNRNKESKDLYIKYLQKNPFSKTGWYNLGVVYTKLEELNKAIEAFDFALSIDPEFSSAIYNKAHILFRLKQYQKSIDCYRKILKLENKNPSALFFIAKNYIELKKYRTAAKYLKQALRRIPAFPQAWFEIGRIYFLNKKFNKSKNFVLKAIRQGEINSEYLKLLGKNYIHLKQYNKAAKALHIATLSNPFDDEIWYLYSEVHELKGNIQKAIEILSSAKDFIINKITYTLRLAKLYFISGQTQKARQLILDAQLSDKNNSVSNFVRNLCTKNDKFAKFILKN